MGLSLVQGPMGPPRRRKSCPRKWSLGAQKNAFLYGPRGTTFLGGGPRDQLFENRPAEKKFSRKKKNTGSGSGNRSDFFF